MKMRAVIEIFPANEKHHFKSATAEGKSSLESACKFRDSCLQRFSSVTMRIKPRFCHSERSEAERGIFRFRESKIPRSARNDKLCRFHTVCAFELPAIAPLAQFLRIALILLVVIFFGPSCSQKSDEDSVVALIGKHKITLAHFLRSYRNEITKTPVQVQDSPQLRRDHLNTLIARFFLAQEATAARLQNLPGFKKAMQAESTAVIIHGLFEEEIAKKLNEIPEAELQDAYKKMSAKYHARHLLAKSESAADSLYQRLQRG